MWPPVSQKYRINPIAFGLRKCSQSNCKVIWRECTHLGADVCVSAEHSENAFVPHKFQIQHIALNLSSLSKSKSVSTQSKMNPKRRAKRKRKESTPCSTVSWLRPWPSAQIQIQPSFSTSSLRSESCATTRSSSSCSVPFP